MSRWEGAGYHSESTSEHNLETLPIVEKITCTITSHDDEEMQFPSNITIEDKLQDTDIDDDSELSKINKSNQRINGVFGNFLIRSLYINSTLSLFCILSFPLWFESNISGGNDIINAYILGAFSIFLIFIASVFGLLLAIFDILHKEIPFKKRCKNIAITLYIIGGFFHFVGGCQYAQFYNNLGRLLHTDLSAFGGVWWTEMFYISIIAIICGIDLYKPFLNRMDHRIYLCFALYIFCAMVLMCCYLITNFISIGVSYLFGFMVATMWLLMYILSIIITKQYNIKPKLDAIKPILDSCFAVLLFIIMFTSSISYWSTTRARPQEDVYYAGYGIFMLSLSILMSFDMRFSLYIAPYVDPDYDSDDE